MAGVWNVQVAAEDEIRQLATYSDSESRRDSTEVRRREGDSAEEVRRDEELSERGVRGREH